MSLRATLFGTSIIILALAVGCTGERDLTNKAVRQAPVAQVQNAGSVGSIPRKPAVPPVPAKEVREKLHTQILRRFNDIAASRFGISRMYGMQGTHFAAKLEPENDEERELIKQLETNGYNVLIYTGSNRPRRLSKGEPQIRVNGPSIVAGDPLARAVANNDQLELEGQKVLEGSAKEIEHREMNYTLFARPVIASKLCLDCHSTFTGLKAKEGDKIGFYMLAFGRKR